MLLFPMLDTINTPVELLASCLNIFGPTRRIIFEIPVKACDFASYGPSGVRGLNAFLGVKALLEMLPLSCGARHIRVLIDYTSETMSPRICRHGLGKDLKRWLCPYLETVDVSILKRCLDSVPRKLQFGRKMHPEGEAALFEPRMLLEQRIRRKSLPRNGRSAKDALSMCGSADDNILCDFFDFAR
jgi:hypothetical protein